MPIRNLIFDLGGVILDIDISKTQKAFEDLGLTQIKDLFGLGKAASFFKDHEQGRITDEQFVQEVKNLVKEPLEDDMIIGAWNKMLLEFPKERIEFLQRLKKKYRLFLFSNTNGIHLKAFQQLYHSGFNGGILDDLFEKAYYSHLMGLRKPDRKSFDYIIKENDLIPSDTLFVDDAMVNLDGAKEAGLQTFLIKPGTTILDIPILDEV